MIHGRIARRVKRPPDLGQPAGARRFARRRDRPVASAPTPAHPPDVEGVVRAVEAHADLTGSLVDPTGGLDKLTSRLIHSAVGLSGAIDGLCDVVPNQPWDVQAPHDALDVVDGLIYRCRDFRELTDGRSR